jgi:hypothetical protein
MPARQDRQPLVDIRRRRRADGSVEEIPTVRYWDAAGKRRRLTCETTEEAGSSVSSGLDRRRGGRRGDSGGPGIGGGS